MSAIINPRTGRPADQAAPAIVAPTGQPVTTEPGTQSGELSPGNIRDARGWQKAFRELQQVVRENFVAVFPLTQQAEMESRLAWLVHMITFEEVSAKLQEPDIECREMRVFVFGWQLLPTAGMIPGAIRADFVVASMRTTPEFVDWLKKARAEKTPQVTPQDK